MYSNNRGYWNGKKEKIKQIYPTVKDEDLNFPEGKEVVMIEMLGYKLGMSIEEIRRIIVTL